MDAWNLITCDKSAVVSNGKTCKVLIPCVQRMGWIKGSLAESHDFKGEHLHVITSFCPAAVHFLIIQIALKKNVGELLRYGRRFACLHLFFCAAVGSSVLLEMLFTVVFHNWKKKCRMSLPTERDVTALPISCLFWTTPLRFFFSFFQANYKSITSFPILFLFSPETWKRDHKSPLTQTQIYLFLCEHNFDIIRKSFTTIWQSPAFARCSIFFSFLNDVYTYWSCSYSREADGV